MFRTTTPRALRAVRARPWPSSLCTGAGIQQRGLSTSPSHRVAHIIAFNESSSPELGQVLETLRQKIILPSYLSEAQREKMYDARFAQQLQHDPITMEIDGVVHKFRHEDRMKLPAAEQLALQAVKAMRTPQDLENLPMLLQGVRRANRKLPKWLYVKMIRQASKVDRLQIILDCVLTVRKTGFKLDNSETIQDLLGWVQAPAIDSGWDRSKLRTAIGRTQIILDLLESEPSHNPKPPTAGRFPFYRDPQVLANRLHLAAALAVVHQDGTDADGQVTKYAKQLVKLWPMGAGLLDLQPSEAYRDPLRMKYMLERNTYLWHASPVLNALTLAAKVVDPGLAVQLQNRADAVDGEVRVALGYEKLVKGRGWSRYEKLFGPRTEGEEEQAEEADGAA